jgi:hypothetical protein
MPQGFKLLSLTISKKLEFLIPLPGDSNEIASKMLVFPTPFSPIIASGRPDSWRLKFSCERKLIIFKDSI